MLAEKHPHPRDSRIEFIAESHTYRIDGSSAGVVSTTSFLHSFFPHFQADEVLAKMSTKSKSEKYPGLSDIQIKSEWARAGKEASQLGTVMHAEIEAFYNRQDDEKDGKDGKDGKDEEKKLKKEHDLFLQFHAQLVQPSGMSPYRTEWSVFDETILLAGQIDMVFRRPDGKMALYDWKRVKELKMDNRWEKGYGPCAKLDHCNRVHYSLQLNIYKRILETKYGLEVAEMNLILLHPDQEEFVRYRVPDMQGVVEAMMATRRG